ncbi:MAG: hypothetical protein CVT75_02840 [Alphaproteobacteria bacterium HGW-Alphaproteobacteria-14]|nr:MAG: hypothetical protein CVT75_02840 [Alphaproteobacteria bacterium HGW-Alphaproteobacteria-14]
MTIKLLALPLLLLLAFPALADESEASGAIVVQNHYHPKAGKEQLVLETRLRASAVRKHLGLVVGRVLVREDNVIGQPYVIWEADYPSADARARDLAALDNSESFKAIQQQMGPLLEKFERVIWRVSE